MSLPVPSTGGASSARMSAAMDPRELEAFDAPLIALTQRCDGDLRKLLSAFFSFLHRRTDFYLVPHGDDLKDGKATMGFQEGDAEKVLIAAFRQFPLRRIPSRKQQQALQQAKQQQQQQQQQAQKQQQPQVASTSGSSSKKPPSQQTKVSEASAVAAPSTTTTSETKATASAGSKTGDVAAGEKTTTATKPGSPTTKASSSPTIEKKDKEEDDKKSDNPPLLMEGVRYTDEGLQIPVGNGGSTPKYKWTQTIDECSVMLGVPEGCRGKDLVVEIKSTSVSVRSKKPLTDDETEPHVFLEGTLAERVVPSESTWSLEGGALVLILDKRPKTFWRAVLEGDEEIDTSMVDSRRHIGEYNETTQAHIRKCIFDQTRSRKGLPTSDEMITIDTGGENPVIPSVLPPGVEFLDQEILEKKIGDKEKKKNEK